MNNEEILEMNKVKKFDIILSNPPYGAKGNDIIHLKFVDKCLDIADKQIVIYPFTFVTKVTNKVQNKFKERFSKYLISVEEVDSKLFETTRMPNCGIYVFDDKKKEDIKIINYSGDTQKVKSLEDISIFNDYETNIIKYLEDNGQQPGLWAAGHDHCTKRSLAKQGITDEIEVNKRIKETIISNCKKIPKDKIYLLCPQANFSARFISGRYGDIYDDYNELIDFVTTKDASSGYIILLFNSLKEAENCKISLQNSLLRLTLYRTKDDQNMGYKKCYKYIPAIDWSNDKVKTDEGLLEICGCPKDKCKEYAEYCKKIIDEVDKK